MASSSAPLPPRAGSSIPGGAAGGAGGERDAAEPASGSSLPGIDGLATPAAPARGVVPPTPSGTGVRRWRRPSPMRRVALRGLRAHRFRLAATMLAVVLGVSFMVGTAVLADTVQSSFDGVFVDVYGRIDVLVRDERTLGGGFGGRRARVDDAVVGRVAEVPGVAVAEGQVEGIVRVVDARGRPMYNPQAGPPTLALNWLRTPALNGWTVVDGAPPASEGEIVLDRRTAVEGGYRVGDDVRLLVAEGPIDRRLAGVATFSGLDTYSGSSAVLFDAADAQRLVGEEGRFDWVSAVAEPGVSPDELADRVRAAAFAETAPAPEVPPAPAPGVADDLATAPPAPAPALDVLTGAQLAQERQDFFARFISLFTQLLSAFGLIALFVGSFVIFNTFAIIVSQRTRELALLRAVGASRGQVLRSVLTEAVAIGLVSSAVGVVAGLGVARLLRTIIGAFGFVLPDTPVRFVPGRALLPVACGLAVTVAAAVIPAVRASRTAPVRAMREAAVDRSRHPAWRLLAALPFLVVAGLVLRKAFAMVGEEAAPGWALLAAVPAVGALAVAGPVLAPPVATVVSAPFRWLFGITGRLAGRNAVRNPTRTSSTACALVIGVALVCAIGVLASSLSTTVERNVDRTMAGDFMVLGTGFGGISPMVAESLRPVPGVDRVVGVRGGPLEVAQRGERAVAADVPALAAVTPLDVRQGALDRMGPGAIAVSRDQAEADGVTVGQRLPLRFLTGQQGEAEVVAVYDRSLTPNGEYLLDQSFWDANLPPSARADQRVLITLAPGVAPADVQPRLEEAATAVNPAAEVLDVAGYRERQVGRVMQRITYLYALLALSVIVGILGIVNTLLLSVHERAREIGLLRCVGTRRRQIAGAVLQEAVLIAAPGAVFGVLFGVVVGWAVVRTVRLEMEMIFVVPVKLLVIVALASGLAGLLAGLYPAWRAGRTPVSNLLSME